MTRLHDSPKAAKLAKPLYCKALRCAEPEELSRFIGVQMVRVRVLCGSTRPAGGNCYAARRLLQIWVWP